MTTERIHPREYQPNPHASLFGQLATRLHEYLNPSREEIERRNWRQIEKRWNKYGRDGFIVVRSAEGAMSTPESIRGLWPADNIDTHGE